MRVLTGPQGSPDDCGELAELAGIYGLTPVMVIRDAWLDVNALYCAPGWDRCPVALADVEVANAFGIKAAELPPL